MLLELRDDSEKDSSLFNASERLVKLLEPMLALVDGERAVGHHNNAHIRTPPARFSGDKH